MTISKIMSKNRSETKLHFLDEADDEMEDIDTSDNNAGRYVRYQFSPQFLNLKTIGAT